MDLRGLVNSVTSGAVHPNIIVTVSPSTGYTVGAGRKQSPTYGTPVTGPASLQALDGEDLKQLDGLNIQGTIKAIYLRGNLAGVITPTGEGGDMVQIAAQANVPAYAVGNWLVVKVLEGWANWTKAAIVLQAP